MADRFVNEKSLGTTAELMTLADEIGISATTLAVAWSKQHPFVASTIMGANTVEQLECSLKASDLELDDDVMKKVDGICSRYPNPLG
jgi:aryl-alcohol dehydrogenase-like predicted oxidoreductase